ncbi:hypothetical protein [Rhizobium sp. R86522]|uniref:hypothetical protein n=1 Tax=Rhizobium sp. R86522 TaxID=3093861 RepID=UPI00366C8CDB
MASLKEVAEHLSTLENLQDDNIFPWTDVEREALAEYARPAMAGGRALNAYISYQGSCGFANAGQQAYVVNKLSNAVVNATVRVRWSQGVSNGQYDTVVAIPAGSRALIGCTRGNGVTGSYYEYSVVGSVP